MREADGFEMRRVQPNKPTTSRGNDAPQKPPTEGPSRAPYGSVTPGFAIYWPTPAHRHQAPVFWELAQIAPASRTSTRRTADRIMRATGDLAPYCLAAKLTRPSTG
jgi:hypothetical protein